MKALPHHYEVSLNWKDDRYGTLTAVSRPAIEGGPPPEFDGRKADWSPEHLLLASVDLCLMTTFMVLSKKKELKIKRYESRISGTLDRTSEGLTFTRILQEVDIEVAAGDVEKTRKLIEAAKKYCLIGNSLKPEIRLDARVRP